ncbi:phosphatidylserine/phosphatidylglycerophosphate/cardiolipin synthase family protein [uncultured Serinicoccus sp.]|uniref:phospholipase D-like domain-containing protein n=1 Tax=uncultured Serinicoccus sp. TaxID=735514 RepID=UPI002617AB6E|nr:phosphatidylserine/phosphatidylglycerophosphate/cardiolipin synthase family protein [uncultured Serinicoccus sp.]
MPRVFSRKVHRLVRRGRRLAVGAAGVALAGQLTLAAGVVAVDALRKRRDHVDRDAPVQDPVSTTVEGSRVTTYTYGRYLYDDMIAAIDEAQDYVYLASYIWKADDVGRAFKEAVVRAADRGVLVCLVVDGFANLVVPREFLRFPDGVHMLRFPVLRTALPIVDVRASGRDHRKILVVDGRVGFVGGYNIGSLYATSWRDTHVRVEGPSVWELQNAFADFWNRHKGSRRPRLLDSGTVDWKTSIRAARNEPSRVVYPVRALYLDAMDRAVHSIWITQGYFIPDREILHGLLTAATRGVDVRVVLPEASNHVLADVVAQSYYETLLEGGVRIFLYQDVMVHAKTMTVDGRWATIGTANIDRLSMQGNYEINLEIVDEDQAAYMEDIFRADLERCEELTLEAWGQRGVGPRVVERVLQPLQVLL